MTTEQLKVIEIKIEKGGSSELYQTGRGEVYIRRDGSVQELSASAIQEYTRLVSMNTIKSYYMGVDSVRTVFVYFEQLQPSLMNKFELEM